jgi:hypothetical protein
VKGTVNLAFAERHDEKLIVFGHQEASDRTEIHFQLTTAPRFSDDSFIRVRADVSRPGRSNTPMPFKKPGSLELLLTNGEEMNDIPVLRS